MSLSNDFMQPVNEAVICNCYYVDQDVKVYNESLWIVYTIKSPRLPVYPFIRL